MPRSATLGLMAALIASCSGAPPTVTPTNVPPPTAAATNPPASGPGYAGTEWSAAAQSYSTRLGEQFTFLCPPNAATNWPVDGTDVYTTLSSVCTAGVHVGLITFVSGGEVTIEIRPGEQSYVGSTRNGVTTESHPQWSASFVFVGQVPPSQPPPTSAPSAGPSPGPSASIDPALEAELVRPGELIVCSSFPRTRFAEYDSSGNPFGVDVEIGQALADEMGLAPDVEEVAFEDLIRVVASGGQCDVSIAGQFITSSRLEQIDMIPYREGAPHVIVRKGNPEAIESLEDLCGRGFSVVAGTIYADIVRGEGDYIGVGIQDRCANSGREPVQLLEFTVEADAQDALADGDVDAYAGNDFVTVEQPNTFELAFELPRARNGIGHHKDMLVLDTALRTALRAIIADGTYLQILERYGAEDARLTITP